MNSLQLAFSLTISGSIISLLLFSIKPFTTKIFSKTWHYYIWLIVILRLLLPFSPETNLMNALFYSQSPVVESSTAQTPLYTEKTIVTEHAIETEHSISTENPIQTPSTKNRTQTRQNISSWYPVTIVLWIVIFSILLLRKIYSYSLFIKESNRQKQSVLDTDLLRLYQSICTQMQIKRIIPLYKIEKLSTPMLVGTFRPFIAIPNTSFPLEELEHILHHELIHYKRGDIFYKWLVQITLCLHWYNPIVHIVSKEINNQCELSCDELVVKNINTHARKTYGKTLLLSASLQRLSKQIVSMGLSSDGKLLKERLITIKTYRKKSNFSRLIAIFLVGLLSIGAMFLGSCNTHSNNTPITEVTEIPEGEILLDFSHKDFSAIKFSAGEFDVIIEEDTKLYFDIHTTSDGGAFDISLSPQNNSKNTYSTIGNDLDLKQWIPIEKGEYILTINCKNVSNANISVKVVNPNGTGKNAEPISNSGGNLPELPELPETSAIPPIESGVHFVDEKGFSLIDTFSYAEEFTSDELLLTLEEKTTFRITTNLETEKGLLTFTIVRPSDSKLFYSIQSNTFDNIDEITLEAGIYSLKIKSEKGKTENASFSVAGVVVESNLTESVVTESVVLNQMKKDGIVYNVIESEEDLSMLADGFYPLSENYILGNDIILIKEWRSIGSDKTPFTGIFDGNSHIISNLTASKGGAKGFFGSADGAIIRNVKLKNSNLYEFFPMVGIAREIEFENNSID